MQINEHIHYVTTAYKDIFTTVYALKAEEGAILFDAASFASDIDGQIVPFLENLHIQPQNLKYVFISHNHADHSGGLPRLLERYPDVCIVTRSETLREKYADHRFLFPEEGDMLLDTFRVVTIPGHTIDSAALLDERTMTLITGDCLQQRGIRGSGDWASNISFPGEHLAALEKVRALGVKQIATAHDYVPCGFRAEGENVDKMLDACVEPLLRLKALIREHPEEDDGKIRSRFSDFDNQLTISPRVVAVMRKALSEGAL